MQRLRTVTSLDVSAVAGHHAMPVALLLRILNEYNFETFIFLVKTCIADDIDHATRDKVPSTYNYDTSVVYSCNTGYSATAGDLSRKCIDTNTWSGTAPTCSRKLVCMKDADNFHSFYLNNLSHE